MVLALYTAAPSLVSLAPLPSRQVVLQQQQQPPWTALRSMPLFMKETTEDEEDFMPFEEDEDATAESAPDEPSIFDVRNLPGICEPLGLFDPAGFSKDQSEGKIKFYREVELKHSRIAMLAALGFPIGEQFHPLFGGEVDVPSYIAFQEVARQPRPAAPRP
jgi:hypothetical protein